MSNIKTHTFMPFTDYSPAGFRLWFSPFSSCSSSSATEDKHNDYLVVQDNKILVMRGKRDYLTFLWSQACSFMVYFHQALNQISDLRKKIKILKYFIKIFYFNVQNMKNRCQGQIW